MGTLSSGSSLLAFLEGVAGMAVSEGVGGVEVTALREAVTDVQRSQQTLTCLSGFLLNQYLRVRNGSSGSKMLACFHVGSDYLVCPYVCQSDYLNFLSMWSCGFVLSCLVTLT